MIAKNAFLKDIAPSAHSVMQAWTMDTRYLTPPTIASKRMTAYRFAEWAIERRGFRAIICEHSLPQTGYVSWLLVQPFLGIAFDTNQLHAWSQLKGENAPATEIQIARALVHEVGHIYGSPGLLSRQKKRVVIDGRTFTACATEEEEERAWVWAMCAFGIALGDHAAYVRHQGEVDDSTTRLI
jgi:hypothetical protein